MRQGNHDINAHDGLRPLRTARPRRARGECGLQHRRDSPSRLEVEASGWAEWRPSRLPSRLSLRLRGQRLVTQPEALRPPRALCLNVEILGSAQAEEAEALRAGLAQARRPAARRAAELRCCGTASLNA